MNSKVYRQYDSRWGSLAYPTSYSPVSSDGCGLCSVTHCAIELSKYANSTPKDFISFMRQYAVAGNGTRWDGIDAGLKQFIGNSKRFYDMSSFWAELNKGNRVGVILFGAGAGPDGTLWTTGGHYVAFTGYKYENGKHWLYTKDSGPRCHDGWYAYETSMKGRISILWTAEIPKTGWYKEDGAWYFYSSGAKVKNGWAKDSSGKWFYLGADGKMVINTWIFWNKEWYYLGSDGAMFANAWAKDSKGWYYLNASGKILKSTWIHYKNKWYYLKSSGLMAESEWIYYKKVWYYLKEGGAMAENEWIKWKGGWYYLKSGGAMATGTLTIDGKTYSFDANGKWIEK